ncbi:MAG: outer membrane lipoprotein LolB [Cryomorphaceae bacterium]
MFLAICCLTACQTLPDPSKPQQSTSDISSEGKWLRDSEYFDVSLNDYRLRNTWQLTGKVGVKTSELNESANIVWKFSDQSNQLRMFGPLGAGAIKLDFDRYGVQLSDNKGVLHRGNSAEQLLTNIVGWPIPIEALKYWLFALPNPEHVFEYQLNPQGQLSLLRQLGWQIDYSGYKTSGSNKPSLPRRLTAVKRLSNGQAITVKLIAKAWQW